MVEYNREVPSTESAQIESLQILITTDQNQDHPTSGRRRRHKSPAATPYMHDLPLPRLADHMAAENGYPMLRKKKRK